MRSVLIVAEGGQVPTWPKREKKPANEQKYCPNL